MAEISQHDVVSRCYTLSEALVKTDPNKGSATLLAFFMPEDLGSSYVEHEWSVSVRTKILVDIANGESQGVRPPDQLAAIAYLDKGSREALISTGQLVKGTVHRESEGADGVRITEDVEVMKMIEPESRGEK